MPIFKKLLFAPIFLITISIFFFLLSSLFKSYDFIFSFSAETFIQLIIISVLLFLSCFLFVIFSSLSMDFKIALPVGILASAIPFLFMEIGLAIVFFVGILISLFLTYLNLQTSLKSYLTFSPNTLFGPAIRYLGGLLIFSVCLVYFLSANKMITQQGFQIPDSLIESALKLNPLPQLPNQEEIPIPQLTNDQIDLLKKNPTLLKQSGLDPKILDTLDNQSKNPLGDTIKQTVKDQFQNLINPYIGFIPAILAILLFLTLQSLISVINLLTYPLLWITFYILEKIGFVKFEMEQRPVKKMIV